MCQSGNVPAGPNHSDFFLSRVCVSWTHVIPELVIPELVIPGLSSRDSCSLGGGSVLGVKSPEVKVQLVQ